MRVSSVFAAVLTLTVSAASLQAQTNCTGTGVAKSGFGSCIATAAVAVDVPFLAQAAATTVPKVTVSAANLNAGFVDFAGPTVTVKSNFSHTVTATAAAFSNSKLAAKLGINTTAANYAFLSEGRAISSGAAATAETVIPTFLRLNLSWTEDAPGEQNTTVTFTVTAP